MKIAIQDIAIIQRGAEDAATLGVAQTREPARRRDGCVALVLTTKDGKRDASQPGHRRKSLRHVPACCDVEKGSVAMANDDGDRKKTGPRTVVLQEALAKQDAAQAREIRAWADALDAASTDIVSPSARVGAITKKMRATADAVETFATELLTRLDREAPR